MPPVEAGFSGIESEAPHLFESLNMQTGALQAEGALLGLGSAALNVGLVIAAFLVAKYALFKMFTAGKK